MPRPKDPASPAAPGPDDEPVPPGRRVTLRDIAKRFGVSHVTVAYALRGVKRVSEERRRQICEAAEEMGYRPDPMLNALSNYRLSNRKTVRASLAWLCCWHPPEEMHRFKEFQAYWQGAREVAQRCGYRLEEFAPGPRLSLARIDQILQTRGIRGILVPPPQSPAPSDLRKFPWDRYATVKFGHAIRELRVNLVTSAHVFNSMLAVQKMTERGYRRVGFVTVDLARRTQLLSGFLRAQVDLPAEDRVPFLSLPEKRDPADLARLRTWLDEQRPDALLTNIRELRPMLGQLGLSAPADIGLAVMSVHDGGADAGVNQHPEEIGRAAAEMLVSLLSHGSVGPTPHPRELLIEGSWQDGPTLPPRAPAAKEIGAEHSPAAEAVAVELAPAKAKRPRASRARTPGRSGR